MRDTDFHNFWDFFEVTNELIFTKKKSPKASQNTDIM